MKAALEILGIPAYHWITMIENPADMRMWEHALKAKFMPDAGGRPFTRAHWDELLGDVGAITDYPAVVFAPELVETYPDAKVILVERDMNGWYESYNDSVIKGAEHPLVPVLRRVDPAFIGMLGKLLDLVTKHYFGVSNPQDIDAWRSRAKETYLRHNQIVKSVTPENRLLLFQFGQGWKPLCDFLGKEVPPVPFPRANERKDVDEKAAVILQRSIRRSLISWAQMLLSITIAGIATFLASTYSTKGSQVLFGSNISRRD